MLKINLANYKYSSEAIGDFVKSSKVNFIWEFQLDEIFHRIELRYSRLKGKRVIVVDGHEISKTSKFNLDYNFNFPLGKHFIGITQMDIDKYELKIDNIEIETLYSEIKKNEFIHKIDNFYEDYSENNKKDEGFFSERKNKNEDFDFDFDNGKNNSGKKDNVNKFYFNSEKKQNEEIKKKNKMEEEKLKKNLTKIITKYSKDGKIYVRFPQGFLLPSVFNQTKKNVKPVEKCHVEGCNNDKRYKDPKTGYPYCSVKCFKILRNQVFPEIKIKI